MGWEVKIDMSGQSNDCLWVCNVKMKTFLPGGNGAHFCGFLGFGAIALSDLNLSCPSVYLLQTHFGQYQLDLDGHMGTYMVHVPLHVSWLILHGTFQTEFLGILYHKLSTFMLIRRSTGCFKCDF